MVNSQDHWKEVKDQLNIKIKIIFNFDLKQFTKET